MTEARPKMTVALGPDGATVDAADLGRLLNLDPARVPEKMRAGEITCQSETGVGDDAGRIRLTFWHAGDRVRLVCDLEGEVLTISKAPVGNQGRN
jgi:hypothetical protein